MVVKVQQKQRQKHFNRQIPAAARLIQCVWSVLSQYFIFYSNSIIGDVTPRTKQETAKLPGNFTSDRWVLTALHSQIRPFFVFFFLENFINTLTQLEGSHQRYQQEEERLQYRNCFANKQRWEQVGRAFFLLNPNFLFLVWGLNWTGLCYSPRHQTPWILWALPTFLLPRQDATQWTPQPSRTFSGEFPSDR